MVVLLSLLGALLVASAPEPVRLSVDSTATPAKNVYTSLGAALEAVADARAIPAGAPWVEIAVRPGVYEVRRSVRIGKLTAPLHIRGEGVRLVGGAVIRATPAPLERDDPRRARIPAPALKHVRWIDLGAATKGGGELAGPERHGMNLPPAAGSELFVNGWPLTVARWPNEGFATIDGLVDPGTSKDKDDPDVPRRAGIFRVSDKDHLARWGAAKDVWLRGYWKWDWADDQMPAGKIDVEAGTIALGLPHTYGLDKKARYQVVNIPEELDAPGEYWIDVGAARGYLYPAADQPSGETEFTVSTLAEPMLALDGAADVEVSGIDFEACRGLAVRIVGGERVRIVDCAFRNTGIGAVEIDGHACELAGCTLEDIGAAGVSLTGGDRATLTHADNRVHDCTFRRCGRTHPTYQPAIRLDGVGQIVANNLIEELPHSALMFAGNEHVIELNEIARVLLETGDCGAIYCGRDWTLHGTVIRNNLIRDIKGTDARYQNAVYLDDMASGITVEGNIFLRCNWGMLVGGGRDDVRRGNVFASCRKGLSFDNRGVGWMARNIADPRTSTLHQRLRAVPIDREPWKTRYPTLGAYLTDRFGRPANSEVTGNVLFATPLGTIADRECVRVDGNVLVNESLAAEVLAGLADPPRRAKMGDWKPAGVREGFAAIPVGRIGPRGGDK